MCGTGATRRRACGMRTRRQTRRALPAYFPSMALIWCLFSNAARLARGFWKKKKKKKKAALAAAAARYPGLCTLATGTARGFDRVYHFWAVRKMGAGDMAHAGVRHAGRLA